MWLKAYLDPFHDYELEVQGFPDTIGDKSVVVCARKQQTLVAPPGLDAEETWDVNVALFPVLQTEASGPFYGAYEPVLFAPDGTKPNVVTPKASRGGPQMMNVSSHAVPSRKSTFVSRPSEYASERYTHFDLATYLDDSYSNIGVAKTIGVGARLIAGGFEVENTTPPLEVGGACTVYRQRQSTRTDVFQFTALDGTAVKTTSRVDHMSAPPQSLDTANAILGSRTWAAAEGAYVPFRLSAESCPVENFSGGLSLIHGNISPAVADGFTSWVDEGVISSIEATDLPTGEVGLPNRMRHSFDCSGAYFTGLPRSTTLVLNSRFYIELFPTSDQRLVAMATPSPNPDSNAIALALATTRSLPAGCPRKDNDAGDFFRRVLKVVKDVAPLVSVIAGPAAPLVNSIGVAAGQARDLIPSKKKAKPSEPISKKKKPDTRSRISSSTPKKS